MPAVAETTQFPGSSNLSEGTYDPRAQELLLTFRNGDVYRYRNVPVETYAGLQRSGSAGAYFHRHIRDRFAYTQE